MSDLKGNSAAGINLGIESSWMNSNWNLLKKWLHEGDASTFDYSVGKALSCIHDQDLVELYRTLSQSRINIANEIALSGMTAPKQSHEFIFRLHVLADIETIYMWSINPRKDFSSLSSYMAGRMNQFGGSYREKRYLLTLRQAILTVVKYVLGCFFFVSRREILILVRRNSFPKDATLEILLEKAKNARKARNFDEAYSYVLEACTDFDSPLALLEHARLQWNKGEQRQALKKLEGVLQPSEKSSDSSSLGLAGSNSVVRAKVSQTLLCIECCGY